MKKLEPGSDMWGHTVDMESGYIGAFSTRVEAIADGLRTYGGKEFWIGCGVVPDPAQVLPTYLSFIEEVKERARDEWGELATNFGEEISDEAEEEIMERIRTWARKHLGVDFWIAGDICEKITAVDLAGPPFGIASEVKIEEPEAEPTVDS